MNTQIRKDNELLKEALANVIKEESEGYVPVGKPDKEPEVSMELICQK